MPARRSRRHGTAVHLFCDRHELDPLGLAEPSRFRPVEEGSGGPYGGLSGLLKPLRGHLGEVCCEGMGGGCDRGEVKVVGEAHAVSLPGDGVWWKPPKSPRI